MSYAITHVICYLILLGFPCFRGLPCFHHVLELRGNLTYFASLSVDFLCSDKSLFFFTSGKPCECAFNEVLVVSVVLDL